jgi:hypothetical protein
MKELFRKLLDLVALKAGQDKGLIERRPFYGSLRGLIRTGMSVDNKPYYWFAR